MKVRGVRVSVEEVEEVACKAAGLPTGSFAVLFDSETGTFRDRKDTTSHVNDESTAIISASPDRGRLLAFFTPKPSETPEESNGLAKLRHQLAMVLTPTQLPAVLIPVDGEFPLTTNGKVSPLRCPHTLDRHLVCSKPAAGALSKNPLLIHSASKHN